VKKAPRREMIAHIINCVDIKTSGLKVERGINPNPPDRRAIRTLLKFL